MLNPYKLLVYLRGKDMPSLVNYANTANFDQNLIILANTTLHKKSTAIENLNSS